jgi:hypothetical protein
MMPDIHQIDDNGQFVFSSSEAMANPYCIELEIAKEPRLVVAVVATDVVSRSQLWTNNTTASCLVYLHYMTSTCSPLKKSFSTNN